MSSKKDVRRKDAKSVKRKKHSNPKVLVDEPVDKHAELLGSVTGSVKPSPPEEDQVSPISTPKEGKGAKKVSSAAEEGESQATPLGVDKFAAANYLGQWSHNRDRWSFRKKTQYWLLQNMYDKKKVSKSNFKLLLGYLDGLHGNQRGLAKKRAEDVMTQSEKNKDEIPESKVKYKRAVQVMRVLSK